MLEEMEEDFETAGPTLANHGDSTKLSIKTEERKWEVFCKARKIDAKEALLACKAARFKVYLTLRVKQSYGRIKKESTIFTYWKNLSMLYAKTAARHMDESVLFDIGNWLHTSLTPKFRLDTSEKEKAALFVEDLCVLQNGHWVRDTEVFTHERLRVQMSPLMTIAGCTVTRPSALIGKKPLLYSDIEFQVFPPSVRGQSSKIVMKLNLRNIKRSGGKSRPKIFTFLEEDNLSCSVVLFILALAFADNAFKDRFQSPQDIYNLVVPPSDDRIRLHWDEKWASRPVFHDAGQTIEGKRISNTEAPQYSKHRQHFMRLGRTCGFEKNLEWYDLRRGSGKKLTETLTPEECNQIMSHRSRAVYERHYMPAFIDRDCEAIYLGHTRRDDLVRAVRRLIRHSQAPIGLTKDQEIEVKNHPELRKLYRKRESYTEKIKVELGFPTLTAAKGETEWWQLYDDNNKEICSLKNRLTEARTRKELQIFHETVDTTEVDRQLRGILPSEVLTPSAITYELKERAAVVKLMFTPLEDLCEKQVGQVRVQLIKALSQLCKRQETPHQFKQKGSINSSRAVQPQALQEAVHPFDPDQVRAEEATISVGKAIPSSYDTVPTAFCCAFCLGDEEVGPKKRYHTYSRIDSLIRHFQD